MPSPQHPAASPVPNASADVIVLPLARTPPPITSGVVSLEQRESFRRGVDHALRMAGARRPLVEWQDAAGGSGRRNTLVLLALVATAALISAVA